MIGPAKKASSFGQFKDGSDVAKVECLTSAEGMVYVSQFL